MRRQRATLQRKVGRDASFWTGFPSRCTTASQPTTSLSWPWPIRSAGLDTGTRVNDKPGVLDPPAADGAGEVCATAGGDRGEAAEGGVVEEAVGPALRRGQPRLERVIGVGGVAGAAVNTIVGLGCAWRR